MIIVLVRQLEKCYYSNHSSSDVNPVLDKDCFFVVNQQYLIQDLFTTAFFDL